MASKTSRREILALGAVALVATASGQEPKKEEPPIDTSEVERELAKPLDDRAKKLLKAAVKNSRTASAERLKFKLPENSEPCTMYVPTPEPKR